jgi:addiction module HigA family antidote
MLLENLSFLIASPDLESRTKLREVLRAFVYKGTILQERSLRGLSVKFQAQAKDDPINAVFVAASFGRDAIIGLLQEAESIGARLPPIVIFINGKNLEDSTEVASLYLEGVDGFIREPYSSDELLALVNTLNNQTQRAVSQEAKVKRAAEFLLFDAMAHVDELARQQMQGQEPGGYPLKNLRAVSEVLKRLSEKNLSLYFDLMASAFQKAKPASESEIARKARRVQKKIVHPGALIKEMMRSRNLSKERLLASLRIEPADFDALLNEQRGIDQDIAKELARTLGMTSVEWLRLQREYENKTKKGK